MNQHREKRHRTQPSSTDRARQLRTESTPPERKLWRLLRGRQLNGLKFRRQHPIGQYVVDFYCAEAGLIVELDGMSHEGRVEKDAERTRELEGEGLRVFRVTNRDLRDPEAVANGILKAAGRM